MKALLTRILAVGGIVWDFPPPDQKLAYRRWTRSQEAVAWVSIATLFAAALWGMA